MVERQERPTKVFFKSGVKYHHSNKKMLIHKKDLQFVPVDADPDFDPEHNRRVIEKTIRESERNRREKRREFGDTISDRAQAISYYLKGLSEGRTSTSAERYFGKRELARIRGQERVSRLRR